MHNSSPSQRLSQERELEPQEDLEEAGDKSCSEGECLNVGDDGVDEGPEGYSCFLLLKNLLVL